ncbi:transcription initiation factor TFIID subunit 2 [[Candida] railenensis]|uniref:Transcription initiation factor TFIID subunit 2 n=1 Tax=[Candida] railenensis TaxID=45579 RepID=A0A9P0QTM8_9ASCO|nr:transcription initiation factor TFIID subunit 2 [[Candida] railenensis]
MSLSTHTPRNIKAAKSSSKNVNLSTQNLKVSHQRVVLDVDLSKDRLYGFTEITIIPHVNNLKHVKLDCREMKIKGVTVNGKKSNFVFQDYLYLNEHKADPKVVNLFDYYSDNIGINQHHMIKQKLAYIFGEHNYDPRDPPKEHTNGNTEELSVLIPDSIKLELTSEASLMTPGSRPGVAPGAGPGSVAHFHLTGTPMRTNKNTFSMETYTPLVIKIEYEIINPKNGVNFVTSDKQNKRNWHAYTMNSEYNISTSSWVPCIDNLWERSTWSMELSIPRTVNDIGFERVIGTKEAMIKRKKKKPRIIHEDGEVDVNEDVEGEDDEDSDDEEDDNYDLSVCTGDFNNIKETPHPIDLSKKVVMWSIFNPICAHHIGWAVGPFESVTLPSTKQETEDAGNSGGGLDSGNITNDGDDDKDNGDIPLTVYCLPGARELALNSCIFFNKSMDFFSKEFGSYPFSSYAMAFVQRNPSTNHDFAGLSICSDKLLYPADLIEPILTSTELLLECIAVQWSGINVVAQQFNDLWCTIGITKYMSMQFIRKLMGNNEYRFRIKSRMNEVVESDIGDKNPLALQFFKFPTSTNDFDFIKLKAPLVLFILDKRMTKTDKSFGLSRVLPKIFLQAMSGDLPNGTLSTSHFQYVCEKVNRNKLDSFFKQWVYGAGVPIFHVTQKFNKKRSMIEMSIRQVQQQETKQLHPKPETFINDSVAFLEDEPSFMIRPVFSGPMTIRVHEADGVPYEHIVEIKEGNVKLDIQYNSKFRRKKRDDDEPVTIASNNDFSKLGDVLTSQRQADEWGLVEWTTRDDEEIYNDAFEWIRVDADFEWIAKVFVQQPDYMYGSQLQHDRDVEAQYEAIRYFGDREKTTPTHCTVLTRTIMDKRYYYGVRIAAAKALAELSKAGNSFIGVKYLIKIFKELYCFKGSSIPKSNNFSNFNDFFLQRSIPEALSRIRDEDGNVPFIIKNLLLNLVKFNDNSNNEFQDCLYVSDLLIALTNATLPESGIEGETTSTDEQSKKFVNDVIVEISRIQKLDEWVPSYQSVVSVTCLRQKVRLTVQNKFKLSFEDLLFYTLAKHHEDVRIEAFRGLFILGALKNKSILQYYLSVILLGSDGPYFRKRLIEVLSESICISAINGTPSTLDDAEFRPFDKYIDERSNSAGTGENGTLSTTSGIVIEDGGSSKAEIHARRDAFARATLQGAIEILRRDYAIGKGLKETLWELLHSSLLSIFERRNIFTLCELLYQEADSFTISLEIPPLPFEEMKKKIVVKKLGHGKILMKREGRNKILFGKKEEPKKSIVPEIKPVTSNDIPPPSKKVEPPAAAGGEVKLKLKLGGSGSSKKPLSINLSKPKEKAAAPPPPSPVQHAPPKKERKPPAATQSKVNKLVRVNKSNIIFKLSKAKLKKTINNVSVFDLPARNKQNVESLVQIDGTKIVISLAKKNLANGATHKVTSTKEEEGEAENRNENGNGNAIASAGAPRYVRISLKEGKAYVSANPFT